MSSGMCCLCFLSSNYFLIYFFFKFLFVFAVFPASVYVISYSDGEVHIHLHFVRAHGFVLDYMHWCSQNAEKVTHIVWETTGSSRDYLQLRPFSYLELL